jgi:uncharacterized membrane protein YdbT with pleckstrin-like domain
MGKYVDSNLVHDETVEYETGYHWIIFCNLRAIITLFISPLIDSYTAEFAITNKRVIIKTGLFRRQALEMNLSKIETVEVDQSILGRILGYGTITLIGTGGTRESFPNIANPLEFERNLVGIQLDTAH